LIARPLGKFENLACGARHGLMALDKAPDHVLGLWNSIVFLDRGKLRSRSPWFALSVLK
jgi:hypothetical protein